MMYSIAAALSLLVSSAWAQSVFLGELHYDNTGVDAGEAVEVCGPAGISLDGWSVLLYNGNGGGVSIRLETVALLDRDIPYADGTISLQGTIPDLSNGYGVLAFSRAGIQNGNPDGLALVDAGDEVIQFLSYEGTLTATSGPAAGQTSTDIGVAEDSSTGTGLSLQLTGTGSTYSDFSWVADVAESFGEVNDDMTFDGPPPSPSSTFGTGLCGETAISISAVQGTGTSTPYDGSDVTVKGTVTAVFPNLEGFYIQDDGDGISSSSDGIFVYEGGDPTVSTGDEVAVSGTATENYGQTQITLSGLDVCSTGKTLPDPVSVVLPTDETTLESLEGMLVSIREPVVTENYNAGLYGEITVAAERRFQFTQVNSPGSVPTTSTGTTLIIDDRADGAYPDPDVYVDQASTIRVGQTLDDVEGIMAYGFSAYRVRPTSTSLSLASSTNPRPTSIPSSSGNVRVASFNVLNYFTTLGSRGAQTEDERVDQLAKITAGALALNADAIAIIEVENDYDQSTPSIEVIVNSMNDEDHDADWRYVTPSTIPLGSDVIAVGIIYNANTVSLKGSSDVLDYNDGKTRASLAQTLAINCNSQSCPAFTLVANHFKSKGSACDDLDDPDANDGQGNCNLTRTRTMEALIEWMQGSSIGVSYDPDILLAGDFNAYAQEDPIQTAVGDGFVDLATSDPDYPRVSSYVFSGESGTLDYILASSSAESQRVGNLVHYHVNADETPALEYDNCGGNDACTVSLDQYRCSDHDMVVQDFYLV